ncbi:MAG: 50S ribosomal protein L30 [Caldisphaera sp.]|nr:50S ribosomal protein L30 [Caldisphaera sp.]PMP61178.1 MAG: 50S ribosomal protein L30 [Caldisphaera sp.]PMP90849.1 MAG: 50S ribosomal protein L30 [Caldisphaera sp.]
MVYAIIRIKGSIGIDPKVERVLDDLRLRRNFVAVLYPESLNGIKNLLKEGQSAITWGEIDKDALIELIKRRGRFVGDKPITDDLLKEKFGFGIENFADKIIKEELYYHKLENKGIKPFFRLHPPSGGFKLSLKRLYPQGELGYRGKLINNLILNMA